ncbi:MBL fold metallo-hydrolase [Asanoa sp. NPDC049518]|uniref:MBL fold metallo-hydrolase n=1 Tax=unclassified Asanoa TaxID=2685164 RepID=UPI0034480B2F
MDRHHPICRTCGVQRATDADRTVCPICADERQYVGWGGQRWVSITELHAEGFRGVVRQETPGLWGVGVEPSVCIGQRALVVPGPGGNVLFDCVPYVDDETVAAVEAVGGLAAIAVSHPHFYGSMVEWSKAFGDIPVYVHASDASWVPRAGNIVLWEGERLEILPERTLVNCGIHFPGGTVLHWPGLDGKGALCTGDIFTVVMDRRWVSFMYSYPNLIPEHPDTIVRAVSLVDEFPYDTVYGGWWGRVVAGGAKERVRASADRYLARVGR